jgi:hypothetical protein
MDGDNIKKRYAQEINRANKFNDLLSKNRKQCGKKN